MDKIVEILKKIGLRQQESRVYIALIKLKESQTGNLCKVTKIASSNIYKILDLLIEKGLVSYRVQNNTKIFMPSSPEVLNELFLEKQRKLDEEKKEIQKIIVELKKEETSAEHESNYKFYNGISGIKSMWHEINSKMDGENLVRIYTAKKESYKNLVGFYTLHHDLRQEKKVEAKMIFPKDDRKLADKRRNDLTQIKFMNLKNDCEWGVVGDLLFLQYITSKNPRAFLIKDELFAKTFSYVFDELWMKAGK